MRERDINRKLFSKGHYEIIAARFRHALEPYMSEASQNLDFSEVGSEILSVRAALVFLAVDFARRLQADNEDFLPEVFLNRCSPNMDKFPLGELWKEVEDNASV
jgi:hypothetical protein